MYKTKYSLPIYWYINHDKNIVSQLHHNVKNTGKIQDKLLKTGQNAYRLNFIGSAHNNTY